MVLYSSQLLLKPVEYNLVGNRLTQGAEQNLRLISTIFIYMLRRLWGQPNKPVVRNYEKYSARLLFNFPMDLRNNYLV